ncbi:unnamed protein product [Arctia plantaginis]|uniref:HTH psq-type domain-containing protein n=1 Tax=Arctia plantaginis TaxID=874455 RepID=A0A8S0ZLG3_ARCPL|nr:unnamed protein product [Arctia plantaginis]
MPRKSEKVKPGVRKYGKKSNYTPEILQEAIEKIKSGAISRVGAAKLYKIPPVTLFYKLKEKHDKNVGRPKIFTDEEENTFVSHLLMMADLGYGYEWGTLFLERHPEIKEKVGHKIPRKRAQVNREQIDEFFRNIKEEIEGVAPNNIYNMDETGKKLWSDWLFKAPSGSRMSVSQSGWIDQSIFEDWLENHFLPYLDKDDEEVRQSDLNVVGKARKFQLPVTAGKSVSAEEVEEYQKNREKENKGKPVTEGKKRGRPKGSTNKGKVNKKLKYQNKKLQIVHIMLTLLIMVLRVSYRKLKDGIKLSVLRYINMNQE